MQVIATVGEVHEPSGTVIVGVPDGLGSYLVDDKTVRVVVQSESYGPVSAFESYPFFVNEGAGSFTGSHVQYVDYDRAAMAGFMANEDSAESMVTGVGEMIHAAYNLKGEKIGGREQNSSLPTAFGAHFGSTSTAGMWVTGSDKTKGIGLHLPTEADWTMSSLCSAHLEEKHQWGPGEGVEDRLFLTVEEWTTLADDPKDYVGLSAHTVDVATKTMYATGVFSMGGFEKIIEIKSGHKDYVAYAVSGYNGNFGDYPTLVQNRNDKYGNRKDGKPFVKPQNIVPTRVFIGKKGLNEKGEPATDFLSRNALRFGQLYGFATDTTEGVYRDAWHMANVKGAKVAGAYYPIDWKWDGVVKSFEHDGSFDFQDAPVGAPAGTEFWTASGPDKGGYKTEHVSPAHNGKASYIQVHTHPHLYSYSYSHPHSHSRLHVLSLFRVPPLATSASTLFTTCPPSSPPSPATICLRCSMPTTSSTRARLT
jgi:hypothetical protein